MAKQIKLIYDMVEPRKVIPKCCQDGILSIDWAGLRLEDYNELNSLIIPPIQEYYKGRKKIC